MSLRLVEREKALADLGGRAHGLDSRDGPRRPRSECGVRKARAAAGTFVFLFVAPGVVAGLIPWWLTGWAVEEPISHWLTLRVVGVVLLAAGVVVLLEAFVRFVLEGFKQGGSAGYGLRRQEVSAAGVA